MAGGGFGAVSCYASWTRILSEHRLTPVPFSFAEDRGLLAAVAWFLAVLAMVWFRFDEPHHIRMPGDPRGGLRWV